MKESNETQNAFRYGTNGDEFKPLSEVLLSDVRQTYWVRHHADGTTRGIQLGDLHEKMLELKLGPKTPEDVRTGFETARNLFLYSWFVYRFQTVAELQAYATLELALKKRMEAEGVNKNDGLSGRLMFAVGKGWLKADGIQVYQRSSENRKVQTEIYNEVLRQDEGSQNPTLVWSEEKHAAEYLQNLIGAIPRLRNSVAHGHPMLHGSSVLTLEICCDLINQIFP